jgi:D-proline reductase (dithiol) PrdB
VIVWENREQWLAGFHDGWLTHLEQTGTIDWKKYPRPRNRTSPSGPGVDLAQSRLMLITSAGVYLRDRQEPFVAADPLGDYGLRLFPSSTSLDDLAIAHDHYDQEAVRQDPQVLVPLRHLEGLVAEGAVGELAPNVVSFMGYQPNVARAVDETIPAILDAARADDVQAALLVPA